MTVMLYRMLRSVNLTYPFVILWGYVGLFLLALPFIFIFPPLTVLLVIAGALSVPFVFAGRTVLLLPQRALARRALSRGTCPRCGEFVVDASGEPEGRWHCVSCGTQFTDAGEEIEILGGTEANADHEARLAI
jgi:ribosomal protein S27AE